MRKFIVLEVSEDSDADALADQVYEFMQVLDPSGSVLTDGFCPDGWDDWDQVVDRSKVKWRRKRR